GMLLGDGDLVPDRSGRDGDPGEPADSGEFGPAGEYDQRRGDRPGTGADPRDRTAGDLETAEAGVLEYPHAADCERVRVCGHVAGRMQVAILRAIRRAEGEARRHRRVHPVEFGRLEPADIKAEASLHGHPLVRG